MRRDEVKEDDEKTRAPLGAWAGDCLAVLGPEDVQGDMLDISEELGEMVRKFRRGEGFM